MWLPPEGFLYPVSAFPRSFIAPHSLFSVPSPLCALFRSRFGLWVTKVGTFAVGKSFDGFHLLAVGAFEFFEDDLPHVRDVPVCHPPIRVKD